MNEGGVHCIGSDHASHARDAEERPWPQTVAGLTGVQTPVPVMLDHVGAGRLSLERMVQLMSAGPARIWIYGAVGKGRIAVGYDADFTIADLARRRTIEESWIASPCGWTPFAGGRARVVPLAGGQWAAGISFTISPSRSRKKRARRERERFSDQMAWAATGMAGTNGRLARRKRPDVAVSGSTMAIPAFASARTQAPDFGGEIECRSLVVEGGARGLAHLERSKNH